MIPRPFLALFALVPLASSQQQPYSGATQCINGANGFPAVPAQCPAAAPNSCANIGATNWCCPVGSYCGWAGGNVGCCPYSESCSGYGAYGGGGGYYSSAPAPQPFVTTTVCPACHTLQTTTIYQQVTTVYQQPSTYVAPAAGGAVVTTTVAQAQTTQASVFGGYCSTLYERGPNLPTTRQEPCGTVLILNEAGSGVVVGRGMLAMYAAGVMVAHMAAGRLWAK